jgi:hypothetical protein
VRDTTVTEESMFRKLRPHLTYANVAATIALVLAVGGGTAWAASKVRTRDIAYHAVTASKVNFNAITASKVKNGSLSGKELRDSSVATEDVRNGTLRTEDFGAGQLPKGDKGDKGDPATALHGTVTAAGVPSNGSGVASVVPGAEGEYAVTFDRDVSRCAVVAMVATAGADADGTVTGKHAAGAPQRVDFRTRDLLGATDQKPFSFAVFC